MSARTISESDAWKNVENFSNLKENQTPSLRYSNSLSDPTSWFQWACSSCCCYDKDIGRVLTALDLSVKSIVKAQLGADMGLTPARAIIIKGTISNFDKTADKFKLKEVTEIDVNKKRGEKQVNKFIAECCTDMANALRESFRTNSDLRAGLHGSLSSFDKKDV